MSWPPQPMALAGLTSLNAALDAEGFLLVAKDWAVDSLSLGVLSLWDIGSHCPFSMSSSWGGTVGFSEGESHCVCLAQEDLDRMCLGWVGMNWQRFCLVTKVMGANHCGKKPTARSLKCFWRHNIHWLGI